MNGARKGAAGERELTYKLQEFGFDAVRNYQRDIGGYDNPDIQIPGMHVECKRTECLRLHDAVAQATADAKGRIPVVMSRRNREKWLVTMYLDDWAGLYKAFVEKGDSPQ